jgi:hypothetical protein
MRFVKWIHETRIVQYIHYIKNKFAIKSADLFQYCPFYERNNVLVTNVNQRFRLSEYKLSCVWPCHSQETSSYIDVLDTYEELLESLRHCKYSKRTYKLIEPNIWT